MDDTQRGELAYAMTKQKVIDMPTARAHVDQVQRTLADIDRLDTQLSRCKVPQRFRDNIQDMKNWLRAQREESSR